MYTVSLGSTNPTIPRKNIIPIMAATHVTPTRVGLAEWHTFVDPVVHRN